MDKNYFHINNTIINDLWAIDVGHFSDNGIDKITNSYPYFLIQYIYKGSGFVKYGNEIFTVKNKRFFLVSPDTKIEYYPNKNDPWKYYWINFNGLSAVNLLNKIGITNRLYVSEKPLAKLEPIFKKAYKAKDLKRSTSFEVESCLFSIFSIILENQHEVPFVKTTDSTSFTDIVDYIQNNLTKNTLTAESVAEHFHLNVNYFSTLFKSKCNVRFKEYVNYTRIKKASELLATTNDPIKNVAAAIGFSNPLYFSKVFQKLRLMTPSQYREENKIF